MSTLKKHDKNYSFISLLVGLKKRYGVTQDLFARMSGVSKQVLTDIKAGRRKFSNEMVQKLLADSQDKPWKTDVAEALSEFIKEREEFQHHPSSTMASHPTGNRRLPMVNAPVIGDPCAAPEFTGEYFALPNAIERLDADPRDSYVLILQNDDCLGRLRSGDLVVITQNSKRDKEIMVVEHSGLLRLARNTKHIGKLHLPHGERFPDGDWIALDSGSLIPNARPQGAVIGIVWAVL